MKVFYKCLLLEFVEFLGWGLKDYGRVLGVGEFCIFFFCVIVFWGYLVGIEEIYDSWVCFWSSFIFFNYFGDKKCKYYV